MIYPGDSPGWLKWLAAAVAGVWHYIPQLTQALLLLMAIDIAMGLIVAIRDGNMSAGAAFVGITKKLSVLMLIAVAAIINPHVVDVTGVDLIQAASAFYIVGELTSIGLHAEQMGVPVFSQLGRVAELFSAKSRGGDDDAV